MATRAQIEGEIAGRARVALQTANVAADPVGDASPRDYLNGPLRAALAVVSVAPTDPFAVADDDIGSVAAADLSTLLDAAELYTLELCLTNGTDVDTRTTDTDSKYDQFWQRITARVKRLRESLFGSDGDGVGVDDVEPPEVGVISLGFVERGSDGGEFG